MEGREHAYPFQLSGGQQQRVSIVRALALKPEILFFDEPTSALDPELTGEILKVIRQLAEERMTMVIVTHEINFARNVSDRIVFMADGLIVEDILDTGVTLSNLVPMLKMRNPNSVKICTILDKPSRRKAAIQPDYEGFQVPDEFVVGYGLDYDEKYRNLPYVGVLKPAVYEK